MYKLIQYEGWLGQLCIYSTYLSLLTQTADANPFPGTHWIWRVKKVNTITGGRWGGGVSFGPPKNLCLYLPLTFNSFVYYLLLWKGNHPVMLDHVDVSKSDWPSQIKWVCILHHELEQRSKRSRAYLWNLSIYI